jgi:hypothetical protein
MGWSYHRSPGGGRLVTLQDLKWVPYDPASEHQECTLWAKSFRANPSLNGSLSILTGGATGDWAGRRVIGR